MSAAPPKMSVDEIIIHYQRSIERSPNDSNRILHCLDKLQRLPVTLHHLESTGIGRTVNMLRKDEGEVGSLAKELIQKWKEMVHRDPQSDGNSDVNEPDSALDAVQTSHRHHEHSSSKHKSSHRDESKHHSRSSSNHRKDEHKSSAEENGEKSSKRERSLHESERNGHKSSSHHKDSRHRKIENHHDEQNENKHHKRNNEAENVSSKSGSHKRSRENDSEQSSSSKRTKKCDSTTSPSSSQRNKEKKSSKSKSKPIDNGIEIDHTTGTSFADALGMIEPLPKTKSSSSSSTVKNHKSTTSKTSNLSKSSSSSSLTVSTASTASSQEKKDRHKDKSKPSTSSSNKSGTPTLLTAKANLPPLVDVLKDLPPPTECVIRNDYKPLPVNALVMDCVYRPSNNAKLSSANEAAALCASTTSKNQRTKVYSGAKTGQLINVPSLHELCIRFLQKNVDALEYTGGVPFEILRPVLERATPNQLFTFEHFNPYLMEDSDALWQQHCKNKFRAYKRQEMETWREMYTRCEKEQEERLASLANNIKKSISVAVPVRQTKLAYVDTAVKPPRGIVKKQNQFGTHAKLVATPAARVNALSSVATNIAKVGDVRLRTSAALRDTAQAQSNGALKPKKAPLMMKTLQLMKGRFRR